jgi:hypothetical protein
MDASGQKGIKTSTHGHQVTLKFFMAKREDQLFFMAKKEFALYQL